MHGSTNYNKIMQLQLNYVSRFLVATYCFRPVSVSVHFYVQLLFVKWGFLKKLHVCLLPYEDCYCSLIRPFLKQRHSTFNKDILHSTRTIYIQQGHSTVHYNSQFYFSYYNHHRISQTIISYTTTLNYSSNHWQQCDLGMYCVLQSTYN
jgi:hypothetical protein